jgi:hypothetical protein
MDDKVVHFGITMTLRTRGYYLTRENYATISNKSTHGKNTIYIQALATNNEKLLKDYSKIYADKEGLIYRDDWCDNRLIEIMQNFDLNMAFFKKLDHDKFNDEIAIFQKKSKFMEITDLNKCSCSGYYVMVLDNYCQLYIGTTADLKNVLGSINGFGKCPVCTRLTNGNSLADLHPELLEYWDYDLNENGPEYYTEFSNKSVYWKCHHGHSYEHPIYKYSQFGFYCVICDNRVLVEGINDLASSYPEILNIWDNDNNDVRPNEIFYSPQNSYYYKCDKGHTWYNRLVRVVETDFTCDYCSNRRILPEFNFFKALHHDIANEWNYEKNDTTPDKIFPENTQYRIWTCSTCGMEFGATTRGRVDGSEYCSYCANKKATPGKNSFAALYPELLKEFSQMNDFNPDMIFPESSLYTIWDCHKYDMQWRAPIRDVVSGNRECPYCSGQNVVPGHTSLKALHEELALEYYEENDIDCDNILPSYSQRVMWKYQTHGLIYWAAVRGMVDGSESCPYCSERKAVPGVNSLKKLFPTIADELHDERYDADNIFPTLAVRVKWKCKVYGLEYNATIRGMVNGSETCPYCSEKKAVPGETSLKALYSDMVDDEWNYLSNALLGDPDNILPESAKSFFWKCQKCGYVYIASPRDRIRDKLRNMESCSSCKGLRQNFIHY